MIWGETVVIPEFIFYMMVIAIFALSFLTIFIMIALYPILETIRNALNKKDISISLREVI
jgi:hypothetical protein